MKHLGIAVIFIALITGCSGTVSPAPSENEPESIAVSLQLSPESYDLYYQDDDYKLSLYEPPEGSYLGAYVLSNKKINFDMEEFDRLTEKEHALYMYNMKLGDPFPVSWILSCISLMKTPYIVLTPPNKYHPYDEALLEQTAKEFGQFFVPMLVDFYPLSKDNEYEPEAYKDFYRKARKAFEEHASNAAFVWSASQEELRGAESFYPGDPYTDWIGLSLYMALNQEGGYNGDVFGALDYWYYSFQSSKPLIVTQLAVSHFSSENHTYRISPAADEISRIYNKISLDYPRIKGIIYMDFNGIDLSADNKGDNFTVSDEGSVRDAYRVAISKRHFLSSLDMSSMGDISSQLIKSPFPAIKWDNTFYISENTLKYDLRLTDLSKYTTADIDGKRYYPVTKENPAFTGRAAEENKRFILLPTSPMSPQS